jgi:hypothetical protein
MSYVLSFRNVVIEMKEVDKVKVRSVIKIRLQGIKDH